MPELVQTLVLVSLGGIFILIGLVCLVAWLAAAWSFWCQKRAVLGQMRNGKLSEVKSRLDTEIESLRARLKKAEAETSWQICLRTLAEYRPSWGNSQRA